MPERRFALMLNLKGDKNDGRENNNNRGRG